MKRNKYIHKCGPYKVVSCSQDGGGIRMMVYPAFPEYNLSPKELSRNDIDENWKTEPRWAIHRYKLQEGGGPGIFDCIALAEEFEKFLNQQYTEKQVNQWKTTLNEALADYDKKQHKAFVRAMERDLKDNHL